MRLALVILVSVLLVGAASAARVDGTSSADRLVGTPRADAIFGREGPDRIFGGSGDDFLHGGPGRDVIEGGPGRDRIATHYDGDRDIVRCGSGVDVVNADPLDRVAADCELVGVRLARDPYGDAESQHETHAEPDSLTVGRTTVTAFQVGRRFNGGATNIGFAVTNDDGRTWRNGLLPGLTKASRPVGTHDRASDPVVGFDAAGRTWLIAALAIEGPITRLTVSRSPDGITWGDPVVAIEASQQGGISFDKEWLVCDNGARSKFAGRCYLVYTDAKRGDSLGVLSSADGGVTWSAPAFISVTNAVGAVPVIRPGGDLVVPFLWGTTRIGSSVTTDGGTTFSSPVVVSELRARNVRGLRFFPLPAANVDANGRIYVTWHDCQSSPGCETNSIVIASSGDGRSWTAPSRVTSGRNAMLPTIGIHGRSGRIAIAYHVVRPSRGVDVELVLSRASGTGWGAPRRLSAQTMRPEWMPNTSSGRFLADYIGVTYAGARPLVVWVLAAQPVDGRFRQAVYATRG